MGPSFPIRPIFPIDVRPEPGSAITVRRQGTAILIGGGAGAANPGGGGPVTPPVTLPSGLYGGTSGQVLAKASGTDLDFKWITPSTDTGSGEATPSPEVFLDDYFIAAQLTWDSALGKAMDDLPHGGRVFLKKDLANYPFANLALRKSIYLCGNYEIPPFPGTNQSLDLNGLQMIRLKSGGTISIGAGAGIIGCVVAPEGMTFPRTNSTGWTGTAITFTGDGGIIRNCLVVGFDTAVSCPTRARTSIQNLYFDCNNGIDQQDSYDTSRWSGLHGWPFATIEAYAASLNKLQDGDPNKAVDGYDARINVRSGFGIRFRGHADDTHVDDAILVGFLTGLDITGTAGAWFGRLWCECYHREGSVGVKAGKGIGNIHIADYQAWSCAAPILMDCNTSEDLSFGTIEVHTPLYSAAAIYGGNLIFDKMIVRGLVPGQPVISIVNSGDGRATNSRISGTIHDFSFTDNPAPAVTTPPGCVWQNFDALNIQAPYRGAGWSAFGGNVIFGQYLTAAAVVALPPVGEVFKMQGGTSIGGFSGVYGGRKLTIVFRDPVTVVYNSGQPGSIAGSISGVAQRAFPAGGILDMYYDAEFGSWREKSFVDYVGAGGGGTNPAVAAWSAFNPGPSNDAGGGSFSAGGAYLKVGTTVHVRMRIVVSGVGNGGVLRVTLPFAPAPGTRPVLAGAESAATGKMIQGRVENDGSTSMAILDYANNSVLTQGGLVLSLNGTYDSAS